MRISLLLLAVIPVLAANEGDGSPLFEYRLQFRITNTTGKDVTVTSDHTKQTTPIRSQSVGVVPHGLGDITIRQRGGKTWVYKNVSRLGLRLEGTPYEVITRYRIPFGGGTSTVNLLLDKDGRLYAIPPDTKDVDVKKLKQPEGFPIKPDEEKDGTLRAVPK
jgi:hypothetical protein